MLKSTLENILSCNISGNSYNEYIIMLLSCLSMVFYKGYYYYLDVDNLWKVNMDESIFIVALDDSKTSFNRKIISSKNTEVTCKEFIDWFLN